MSRTPSIATKIKRGYGQGTGKDYKPFITVQEAGSIGTCSIIPDYKNGRSIHCLSQGEAIAWRLLRWDDDNLEIYEQFPLWNEEFSNEETVAIAREFGLKHPKDNAHIMTTDFIVVKNDGTRHAYSVKTDWDDISAGEIRTLFIEKVYWGRHGVPFTLLFKNEMNETLASNLRIITEFYDASRVHGDKYNAIKHKLAIKEWRADLTHEVIDTEFLEQVFKHYTGGVLIGKGCK